MKNYYIVTGASSGIGRELCLLLAKKRKNVVAIARRKTLLNELSQQYPNKIRCIAADLSKSSDLSSLAT